MLDQRAVPLPGLGGTERVALIVGAGRGRPTHDDAPGPGCVDDRPRRGEATQAAPAGSRRELLEPVAVGERPQNRDAPPVPLREDREGGPGLDGKRRVRAVGVAVTGQAERLVGRDPGAVDDLPEVGVRVIVQIRDTRAAPGLGPPDCDPIQVG